MMKGAFLALRALTLFEEATDRRMVKIAVISLLTFVPHEKVT